MVTSCCNKSFIGRQIVGVIPSDTCPAICQTITSVDDLPAEPVDGCNLILVRLVDIEGYVLQLYFWVTDQWELMAGVGGVFTDGHIAEVDYLTSGDYTININGNTVSGGGTQVLDPAAESLEVTFTNGSCIYVMDPVEYTTPLAFTYFMDRDLATNDNLDLRMDFSATNQTGFIDWGDGSGLVPFNTGGDAFLATSHLFANSGLSEIKVYLDFPSKFTDLSIIAQGATGTTGGIDVTFEANVTALNSFGALYSSISVFPVTIPTTVTSIQMAFNLMGNVDLTAYTSLQSVGMANNQIESVDLTGVTTLIDPFFDNNPDLDTLTITDFTNIVNIQINGCAFSTASIEALLDGLDSNTLENGFFGSINQTPPAPIDPGYPAYGNLVGKGWTLDTDI